MAGTVETRRVVRLAIDGFLTRTVESRDLLTFTSDVGSEVATNSGTEAAGALRFGPDGYLYVGLGESHVASAPQSAQALGGKVLRIDRDGQAAPGNHAPAGFDPRVFAYGINDPVALAFHANTEALLVGQRSGEEIDAVLVAKPGANGGWDPRCAPPRTGYCGLRSEQVSLSGVEPGTVTAWRGGKAREGLTAIERLRGPMWGEWRNAFVVAFDRAQRLDLVKLDLEGRVVRAMPAIEKLGVGFKAVAQGPDGLYVITSGKPGGEEIWRLTAQ